MLPAQEPFAHATGCPTVACSEIAGAAVACGSALKDTKDGEVTIPPRPSLEMCWMTGVPTDTGCHGIKRPLSGSIAARPFRGWSSIVANEPATNRVDASVVSAATLPAATATDG